ncbi:MAG: cobyrinate a,c-diamide synthase [Cyanobacteriota bacterium]|nr:cobyrinate a,c-diamide synthase [Cyanobacteriota bacterium]
MALAIAGERSGVGKTTITLALLAALARWGKIVQSFKVGPDYIDPLFHAAMTGRPCRNLDPVLTSEEYVRWCFTRHCQGADFAIAEGVMGLFDGVAYSPFVGEKQRGDYASTAHIARLLDIPVLLVIDCSRLSGSVAAIAQGYCTFDPRVKIAGVVLNRVGSDRHQALLERALEPLNLKILGIIRRHDSIVLPERHLGLIPNGELEGFEEIGDRLVELARTCFDWEQLFPLLQVRHKSERVEPFYCPISLDSSVISKLPQQNSVQVKIAVARDRAFNFYYQDNLDLLEAWGAKLVPWSPLNDSKLPKGIQGLYFGGGFPEIFAAQLSDNQNICATVRKAIEAQIPTYAECGGLMYLSQRIVDFNHRSWSMVGALPTDAIMSKRLSLGYRQAQTLQDSPLLSKAETVWGHEFHRSQLTSLSTKPLFTIIQGLTSNNIASNNRVGEGWKTHQVHASYIHLHWGERPQIPQRFLRHCLQFNSIAQVG